MKIFLVTNQFDGHGFPLHSYIIREIIDYFKPFLYNDKYGKWYLNEEREALSSNLNYFL